MNKIIGSLSFCFFCLGSGLAQQGSPGDLPEGGLVAAVAQSVSVTTALEPFPLAESDRSVEFLAPGDERPLKSSVVDVLRGDPSLNLQARGGTGVQADLSVRGTTFEQSLILLNGLRINDPETGHLNLDIPVPLDAVGGWMCCMDRGRRFMGRMRLAVR